MPPLVRRTGRSSLPHRLAPASDESRLSAQVRLRRPSRCAWPGFAGFVDFPRTPALRSGCAAACPRNGGSPSFAPSLSGGRLVPAPARGNEARQQPECREPTLRPGRRAVFPCTGRLAWRPRTRRGDGPARPHICVSRPTEATSERRAGASARCGRTRCRRRRPYPGGRGAPPPRRPRQAAPPGYAGFAGFLRGPGLFSPAPRPRDQPRNEKGAFRPP